MGVRMTQRSDRYVMTAIHRISRRFGVVLVVVGATTCFTRGVEAHPGMSLGLNITVNDEGLTYEITVSNDLYNHFIPGKRDDLKLEVDGKAFRLLDAEQEQRERLAIEAFFKDRNPVTIDGVRVKPILGDMQFMLALHPIVQLPHPALPPDVRFTLKHPTKMPPKRISMIWDAFPPDLREIDRNPEAKLEVWSELDAYDENRLVFFEVGEPEFTWHKPNQSAKQRVKPVIASQPVNRISVPLLSLGLIGVWGVVLLGFRFSGQWPDVRRRMMAITIVPVVTAMLCHNLLVAQVQAPWGTQVNLPGEDAAIEIFSSLQANIYRAFDYKSESDIYDVLKQSVDGPLLDRLYNEVYQSLIMRDQGGAVARVQSVDIIDVEVLSSGALPDTDDPAFTVRVLWQVHGAVSHWGHIHARTNEYRADYTVARRGDHWKIIGVEVLEQLRVVAEEESDAEDEEVEEDEEWEYEEDDEDEWEDVEGDVESSGALESDREGAVP